MRRLQFFDDSRFFNVGALSREPRTHMPASHLSILFSPIVSPHGAPYQHASLVFCMSWNTAESH